MNAASVRPGQVWERMVRKRRLQDSATQLLLVLCGPFDHVIWGDDGLGTSWATNHPQVEVLDLETGKVMRTSADYLLENKAFLLEAAPGETGNSSKSNDLELPIGSAQLSEA